MIKLSAEQRAELLKVASMASDTYYMEKEANLYDVPYVKQFASKVSDSTLDLWRKHHAWAMQASTPQANAYYKRITENVGNAQGEGKRALEGIQRILFHTHPIDAPHPIYKG